MAAPPTEEVRHIVLNPGQEARFILEVGMCVKISVVSGEARSFVWPIPHRTSFEFRDISFPINTATGCTITITGTFVSCFIDSVQPLPFLKDVFQPLKDGQSPTIFVIGSPSAGKTSLCKIIANSILDEFSGDQLPKIPLFVNADPSNGAFSPPGCIGAAPVAQYVTNNGFPIIDPLVYFFSQTEVEPMRKQLFIDQMKELAKHVTERRLKMGVQDGGVIVDFPSTTEPTTMEIINEAVSAFKANYVIVMGDHFFHDQLKRNHPELNIIDAPMLNGVRPITDRTVYRYHQIHRYFYGNNANELNPRMQNIARSDLSTVTLGPLLTGKTYGSSHIDPKVQIPRKIENSHNFSILAIVRAKASVWSQSVMGFIQVTLSKDDDTSFNILIPNSLKCEALEARPINAILGNIKGNLE